MLTVNEIRDKYNLFAILQPLVDTAFCRNDYLYNHALNSLEVSYVLLCDELKEVAQGVLENLNDDS